MKYNSHTPGLGIAEHNLHGRVSAALHLSYGDHELLIDGAVVERLLGGLVGQLTQVMNVWGVEGRGGGGGWG